MSQIDNLFRQLRDQDQTAFMPFVTAGDPDLDFTGSAISTLAAHGASLLEIGFPYSDPIADGPVIQASYTRALGQGLQLAQIFAAACRWSDQVTTPLAAMVSYSIVHRQGLERFVSQARESGFSGLIVPDLLVEEALPLRDVCQREDLSLIQLVTPTTPRDRALRIAESSSGFLYYVSVTGITGERTEFPVELTDQVGWLREQTELPICIGFGISRPEHVKQLAPVADGLIVGSAFVRTIGTAAEIGREQVLTEIGDFADQLSGAL
jgi:tryptophan synthase alpha chain